ncbi:type IV pilin protein [Variovorax paradoxus]|uniref:type IV pilin protein n=1 Tax=Variovorax paradoxus TaxID=34073 RepID=UPI0027855BFC|nr:type IV pilin protein [Variovorax paradoxus]MDQ0588313.1 type IV pilus assembly protein PilE [Variovorax paradoxus]
MKKQASSLRRAAQALRGSSGFTLIEVMIVVAIIAILASIAVPSYNDYVRRGQLPEAFNRLSDYRSKMEQYYQDNRNYGTAANKCASDPTAASWNTFTASDHFSFSCVASGATFQSYTITATGSGGPVTGHVYTINEAGLRKTTKFKNATVDQNCWLTKSATC